MMIEIFQLFCCCQEWKRWFRSSYPEWKKVDKCRKSHKRKGAPPNGDHNWVITIPRENTSLFSESELQCGPFWMFLSLCQSNPTVWNEKMLRWGENQAVWKEKTGICIFCKMAGCVHVTLLLILGPIHTGRERANSNANPFMTAGSICSGWGLRCLQEDLLDQISHIRW